MTRPPVRKIAQPGPKRNAAALAGGLAIPARSLPKLRRLPAVPLPAADAAFALSEGALTKVLRRTLDRHIVSNGGGWWGPFGANYSIDLTVSGGAIELPGLTTSSGAQIVRLSNVVVAGTVVLALEFDLGRILPRLCVPPFRACVHTPWGDVCTPQVCVGWPSISIPIPIPIPPVGVSADFSPKVSQSGGNWNVDLAVFPFSIYLDLRPSADLVLDAVRQVARDTIGSIPLVGGLLDGFVNSVINILQGFIDGILDAVRAAIRALILAIDVISPTIGFRILTIPVRQTVIAASSAADAEVDITISQIDVQTQNHELALLTTLS